MNTEPIYCDDCNAAVRIERTDSRSLKAVCACGETRNVKVANVLPEEWSA